MKDKKEQSPQRVKSITISITIPEQLEGFLQDEAYASGISRSRHIGNVLLLHQKTIQGEPLKCGIGKCRTL